MKKIIHQNAEAGITQYFHTDDEGNVTLETAQDVSAIVEANKQEYNAATSLDRWGEGKKVASIPMSLYYELKAKGILDDQNAFRRWLNSPENRFFRTFPGKV